ncbi:MAG: type II secretion system F family protein, partial [Verrucomicrobiota bacterium]
TLDRTAAFLENQQRVSERVQTALIYPSIVMGAGICVAILMLGLLIPRVEELFKNTGANLPAITSFMIALGNVVLVWSVPVLGAAVLILIFLRRKIANDADFRCMADKKLFSLPVFGRGYRIVANLRFAQTLGALLNSAVPLIDAFKLAARSTGSAGIVADSEKQADAIEHGGTLSDAVGSIPPLSGSLPGMLRVGEAGGDVVGMLDSAASRYSAAWDRFVDRSLSLLEPLLILLIGAFVLLVTISVLMPIMSLTDTLQM